MQNSLKQIGLADVTMADNIRQDDLPASNDGKNATLKDGVFGKMSNGLSTYEGTDVFNNIVAREMQNSLKTD